MTAELGLVRVVGTGLIGTSLGLALTRVGEEVVLSDPSPTAAALARDLGAGRPAASDDEPALVVVAAPPDVAAEVVAAELAAHPAAIVTDVASVKCAILDRVRALLAERGEGEQIGRYVGSHPMAGRERSGAVAARQDLFEGRPWVVTPHDAADPRALALVRALAGRAGAEVVAMPVTEHDTAVAAVSHAPQVAASLVAARLRDLPTEAVALSGQGVRDVTRIAESDPALWTQILAGNAGAVADVLGEVAEDLAHTVAALRALAADPVSAVGARAVLARVIASGQAGRARIPGKHGTAPTTYGVVTVVVPDTPGTIARLLTDVGEAGVNVEDMRIEHDLGRAVGVVELVVVPAAVEPLAAALDDLGWRVHA